MLKVPLNWSSTHRQLSIVPWLLHLHTQNIWTLTSVQVSTRLWTNFPNINTTCFCLHCYSKNKQSSSNLCDTSTLHSWVVWFKLFVDWQKSFCVELVQLQPLYYWSYHSTFIFLLNKLPRANNLQVLFANKFCTPDIHKLTRDEIAVNRPSVAKSIIKNK